MLKYGRRARSTGVRDRPWLSYVYKKSVTIETKIIIWQKVAKNWTFHKLHEHNCICADSMSSGSY